MSNLKRPVPMQTRLAAQQIGSNLSTWRRMLQLTSGQVADRAGISRKTLSRMENGDTGVSLAAFLNVCRSIGILDSVKDATDPFETDFGRARAEQLISQRVRRQR